MLLPRQVYWLAGCTAGLLGAVMLSAEQRRRRSLHRWTTQFRSAVGRVINNPASSWDLHDAPALTPLREALVGASKAQVISALGPPPATTRAAPSTKLTPPVDIWYYPLDLRRHWAVAIHFQGQRATAVDGVVGPG